MKRPKAKATLSSTPRGEPRDYRELSAEKMENNVSGAQLFNVDTEMR